VAAFGDTAKGAEMTDTDLETLISSRGADVIRLQEHADAAPIGSKERHALRSEARKAAADVAVMVAMRSPEKVRALEIERGLC
jgi:hypothetical protein